MSTAPRALLRFLPLLLLALAWEAAARSGRVSGLALPPLSHVLAAFLDLLGNGNLLFHAGESLLRAASGLAIAILAGTALGILMAASRLVAAFAAPLLELFYPLPKSALIPVAALWLGFGNGSKILVIALGCVLPVTLGAFNGARGCDRALVWSARSLGASRLATLWQILVPAALPELLAGIRTALALAFILLVSSELIVAQSGLGYLIGMLGGGGSYDAMFAVVLTVASIGFLADRCWLGAMRHALRWRA